MMLSLDFLVSKTDDGRHMKATSVLWGQTTYESNLSSVRTDDIWKQPQFCEDRRHMKATSVLWGQARGSQERVF
jgi:hypothetical protein